MIGDKKQTEYLEFVCPNCRNPVMSGGLCTYGCPNDNNEDPERVVKVRRLSRVDTVLTERIGKLGELQQ